MAVVTLLVGQELVVGIGYVDQNGQPMPPPALIEAKPQWTNENPAAETLTPTADGLNASLKTHAPGTDLIQVSLQIAGKEFVSALIINVVDVEEPQRLTQIAIQPLGG